MCMRAYIRTYVYMHAYVRICVRACMRAHCTHCTAHTLLGDSPAWFFAGSRYTLPLGVEGGQYPGEITEHDMKRGKRHGTKYVRIHNHQRSTVHPT